MFKYFNPSLSPPPNSTIRLNALTLLSPLFPLSPSGISQPNLNFVSSPANLHKCVQAAEPHSGGWTRARGSLDIMTRMSWLVISCVVVMDQWARRARHATWPLRRPPNYRLAAAKVRPRTRNQRRGGPLVVSVIVVHEHMQFVNPAAPRCCVSW